MLIIITKKTIPLNQFFPEIVGNAGKIGGRKLPLKGLRSGSDSYNTIFFWLKCSIWPDTAISVWIDSFTYMTFERWAFQNVQLG